MPKRRVKHSAGAVGCCIHMPLQNGFQRPVPNEWVTAPDAGCTWETFGSTQPQTTHIHCSILRTGWLRIALCHSLLLASIYSPLTLFGFISRAFPKIPLCTSLVVSLPLCWMSNYAFSFFPPFDWLTGIHQSSPASLYICQRDVYPSSPVSYCWSTEAPPIIYNHI